MVVHTFNPRAWESEAGLSQRVPEQPGLHRETGCVCGGGGGEDRHTDAMVCIYNLSAPTNRREETVSKELG